MNMTLKLTNKEVEKLINNRLENDRFKIIFNDIPFYHPDHEPEKGETHRDYVEDDQREYRWLIFTDVSTGLEHCINYTYNPEWPNDLIELPKSIQIVNKEEDSDIYVKPVPIVNVEKPLTLEAQADKELWQRYQEIKHECRKVSPKEKIKVPKNRIDEILNLLKTKSFNMYQLRAVVIPVCIEYKLEDVTFWHWIQSKSYK